jgi:hypothetical protein
VLLREQDEGGPQTDLAFFLSRVQLKKFAVLKERPAKKQAFI